MTYAALACRGLIGLVFATSAFTKLRGGNAFRAFTSWVASLPGFTAGGRSLTAFAAYATVAVEVAVVILVALPWTFTAGLALAAAVLAVFAAGVFAVVRTGVDISCRCFGDSTDPLSWRHLVRNVALCSVSVIGAVGIGPTVSTLPGIALALGIAAVAAMFVVSLDDLADLLTERTWESGDAR